MGTNDFYLLLVILLLTFLSFCVIISIILSIYAIISVKAMEKSTHNVEYVPIDPNWASKDEEIAEINEKSEMEFPEVEDDELQPHQIDLKKMI